MMRKKKTVYKSKHLSGSYANNLELELVDILGENAFVIEISDEKFKLNAVISQNEMAIINQSISESLKEIQNMRIKIENENSTKDNSNDKFMKDYIQQRDSLSIDDSMERNL